MMKRWGLIVATSALAFGPLSRGFQQASHAFQPPSMPSVSLSRLTGFGEPQRAAQEPTGLATGAQAPVEEFTPLLPEGEATGERGDITALPGFRAATQEGGLAELPSGEELTGESQRQASEFRNRLQRLTSEGGADQATLDTAQALKLVNKVLQGGQRGLKTAQAIQGGLGNAAPAFSAELLPNLQAAPGAGAGITGPAGAPTLSELQGISGSLPGMADLSRFFGPGFQNATLTTMGAGEGLLTPPATGVSPAAGAAGFGAGAVGAALPVLAQLAGLNNPYALAALQAASPALATAAAGAASGAAAGTGALAGAGSSLAAAGPGLAAAAPITAIYLLATLSEIADQERAVSRTRVAQQKFQRGLPSMLQDISATPGLLSQLKGATPEQASQIYDQLRTIGRNWAGGDAVAKNAPSFEEILTKSGHIGPLATFPSGTTQALQTQVGPALAAYDLGLLRAQDIMQGAGMSTPQSGWAYTPESAALTFGRASYNFDPETGSRIPQTFINNPWIQANYQRTVDPAQAFQLGITDLSTPGLPTITRWSPEAQQALAGIQPGQLEAGLKGLFGPDMPSAQGNRFAGFNPFFYGSDLLGIPATEASPMPAAAAPGTFNEADVLGGLRRLVGQTPAGALEPTVPSEFVQALRSPQALQSLLNSPGLLARLFQQPVGAP